MNMSNGSLDCLPYLASAHNSITQRIEDIPHISVKSTFLSGDISNVRKNQSGELCRVAVVRQFQMYEIHPESDCDIKVEKSIWDNPFFVYLNL